MRPCLSLLVALLALPLGAKTPQPKPLDPYLSCGATEDIPIVRTDRVLDDKRQIKFSWKIYDIEVIDGYRLLFGIPRLEYAFANVKIERGGKRYAREKGWIIDQHKHYKNLVQFEERLNGMDLYGSEEDSLNPKGGVVGMYTAFADSSRLVVTAYLLDQAKNRPFADIGEYRIMRREFLGRLTACVDSVARVHEPPTP